MITELSLQNIRVFSGGPWSFSIKPLTVFCGTNSAGKSTLLKLIPLLRQTQGIKEAYRASDARLRFIGSQVDLGDFSCFASTGQVDSEVAIGLTIQDYFHPAAVTALAALVKGEKPQQAKKQSRNKDLVEYHLSSLFCFRRSSQDTPTEETTGISNISKKRSAKTAKELLTEATFSISTSGDELLRWKVFHSPASDDEPDSKSDQAQYLLDVPKPYFSGVGAERVMIPKREDEKSVQLSVSLRGLFPSSIIAQWRPDPNEDNPIGVAEESWGVFPLMPHIDEALKDLTSALGNTYYLGPLRAPAKRYYVTNLDIGITTDPAGEFLPYIMKEIQDQGPVPNIRDIKSGEIEVEPLNEAINYWLHFLRTGLRPPKNKTPREIEVSRTKGVLLEIKIKSPRSSGSYSIADSGFGYSQVLPILITVLLSDPNDTIIVEQPELHLNPSLQVRLAEFIVAMAKTGRQLIVETHSEHIVNSIRVLVAEDETERLSELCALYYIDIENEKPLIRNLAIEKDGIVPDWPVHFFGEAASLAGRLLRAQKRFRSKRKEDK